MISLKKILSEATLTEKKYYITYNRGRGQGKDLEKEFDQKTFSSTNKPKVFNSYNDAKKYAEKMEKMFRNSIGGGTAYWVSDEKMNQIKESVNEDTRRAKLLGIDFNISEMNGRIFFSFVDKKAASLKIREIGTNKIVNLIQKSLDNAYGKGEFFFKGGDHAEFQNGYLFQRNLTNVKLNKLKFESVNEETYKVAGRPVTLIKGKKSNGTDWKVKFQNGEETSLSDVIALIKPFPKDIKESELKGYLAADVVDDIVKTLGSKMVKGHVENAPNKNYIYLKLTDIKFGNDVVKMLKSKFGIDAKVDKTFGNMPTVSFASKKVISEGKIKRGVNRWLELKNDESMHANKKLSVGLKELKYQLAEVEKFFSWYNKIKNINELDSDNYWKRTNSHIYKIKERIINIARTLQEIEK